MRSLPLLALLLAPTALALAAPDPCPASAPAWRHVALGSGSGQTDARAVIADAASWEAWWRAQFWGDAPAVDFAVEFVAALVDAYPNGDASRVVLAVVPDAPGSYVLQSVGWHTPNSTDAEASAFDIVAICRNAPGEPRVVFDVVTTG